MFYCLLYECYLKVRGYRQFIAKPSMLFGAKLFTGLYMNPRPPSFLYVYTQKYIFEILIMCANAQIEVIRQECVKCT